MKKADFIGTLIAIVLVITAVFGLVCYETTAPETIESNTLAQECEALAEFWTNVYDVTLEDVCDGNVYVECAENG